MNTVLKDELANNIYSYWGYSSEKIDICLVLLNYIASNNSKYLTHLTYASLHRIAGLAYRNKDILLVVDYLCKSKVKLLNSNLEYIGGEGNMPSLIDVDKDTKELIHRETGEVITNMSNVFSYFTLTDMAKSFSNYK